MATKGLLVTGHEKQVKIMNMPEFDVKNTDQSTETQTTRFSRFVQIQQEPFEDEFFENINSTPLGRLLKLIATMPEIRQNKVSELRTRISDGEYDINHNLNEAIDRVLEELIAES